MTATLIRQAGPYTVTTDGDRIYVNGQQATPCLPPRGAALKFVLDTGEIGANGKPNLVGLTAEQWGIHVAAREARQAALLAAPRSLRQQRDELVSALSAVCEADYQDRHDAVEALRVTGRDAAAPDRSVAIAAARAALRDFDAAHPEVAAAARAERLADPAVQRALNGVD